MKRILKAVGGIAAVMTLGCLLTASAQARTFVSVNVGVGGYGGGYGYAPRYAAPCVPAPCYVSAPVYAPVYAPAPFVRQRRWWCRHRAIPWGMPIGRRWFVGRRCRLVVFFRGSTSAVAGGETAVN